MYIYELNNLFNMTQMTKEARNFKTLSELYAKYGKDHKHRVTNIYIDFNGEAGGDPWVYTEEDGRVKFPKHLLGALEMICDSWKYNHMVEEGELAFTIFEYHIDYSTGYSVKWYRTNSWHSLNSYQE